MEQVRAKGKEAETAAAKASSTLAGIAPQRTLAEQQRERRPQQMNRLVEESVAAVGEGISADEAGRPANLTAALAWGTRMLAAEPRSNNRDEFAKLHENRRTRLETEAKTVRARRPASRNYWAESLTRKELPVAADSAVIPSLLEGGVIRAGRRP